MLCGSLFRVQHACIVRPSCSVLSYAVDGIAVSSLTGKWQTPVVSRVNTPLKHPGHCRHSINSYFSHDYVHVPQLNVYPGLKGLKELLGHVPSWISYEEKERVEVCHGAVASLWIRIRVHKCLQAALDHK